MGIKSWASIAAFLLAVCFAAAAEYSVIMPEKPTDAERAAAADLSKYLEMISACKFPVGDGGERRIYLGKRAPSMEKAPMKDRETRAKSENGDLYLWGDGPMGSVFAVYDFLEQVMGCRWYTPFVEKIPKNPELKLDDIDFALVPSFRSIMLKPSWGRVIPEVMEFHRRSRLTSYYFCDIPTLGSSDSHTPAQLIPPGVADPGVGPTNMRDPLKYFKKKKYFVTNPEFVTMQANGKRSIHQLCYSNPALRKELLANMIHVIEKEYKGGPAGMSFGLNDNAGVADPEFGQITCACPGCRELARKYRHGAGPYFDCLLDFAEYFKKNYPEIVLSSLIYQLTERPPATLKRMPDNVIASYAPLWKDFLKPDNHPVNRAMLIQYAAWAKRSSMMFVQLYPTIYPQYNFGGYPLVANIHRLAENLRTANKLGVRMLRGEIGFQFQWDAGFNDLRNYLMARMARRVDLDEKALVKEFIDNCYGSAAPAMLKYYEELEALEAAETNFLSWQSDQRDTLTYLTPENLDRWQRDFDAMLAATADEPAANFAVRRARMNLDEATVAVFYKFPDGKKPDLDAIEERWNVTLGDILELFNTSGKLKHFALTGMPKSRRGPMDIYLHLARPKPLPAEFLKAHAGKRIARVFPSRGLNVGLHVRPKNKGWQYDGSAAFGLAFRRGEPLGEKPLNMTALTVRTHESITLETGWDTVFCEPPVRERIHPDVFRKAPPGYHLYFIGRTMLWPDCNLTLKRFGGGSQLYARAGHVYDASKPRQLYDVYLSAKFIAPDDLAIDQVVFVATGEDYSGEIELYEP